MGILGGEIDYLILRTVIPPISLSRQMSFDWLAGSTGLAVERKTIASFYLEVDSIFMTRRKPLPFNEFPVPL